MEFNSLTNNTSDIEYEQTHFNLGIGLLFLLFVIVACFLPILIAILLKYFGCKCDETIKSTEKIPLRRVSINE